MSKQLLECQGLSKRYHHQHIFDHLSFSLQAGEILCLIGPSGGGKTTLLRCLAGLEQLSAGSVQLAGVDITNQRAEARPIIMMFQQPLLFPHLTVLENVTYGLKVRGETRKKQVRMGMEMLEKVEMNLFANQYPFQLSGGQQQRVSLARALILKPQVLLLDEPFSSLDPELRTTIRNWVHTLLKNEGVSALFVTHDREEAMLFGDRLGVLVEGRLQQVGIPLEVYRRPANRLVAEFFAEGLIVPERGFIPAEKLELSKLDPKVKSIDSATIPAVVTGRWAKAGRLLYQVRVQPTGKEVVLWSEHEFAVGEQAEISYALHDLVYFDNES